MVLSEKMFHLRKKKLVMGLHKGFWPLTQTCAGQAKIKKSRYSVKINFQLEIGEKK